MKACGLAVAGCGCAPAAGGEERRLHVLLVHRAAIRADAVREIALAFRPLNLRPGNRRVAAAIRAAHFEDALVQFLIGRFDAREAFQGRRRDEHNLAPAAEGDGALYRERDRVAFARYVGGIGVHLVEEEIARRRRAQAHARRRADHDELPAGKEFAELAVARLLPARLDDALAERRRGRNHRVDADRGVAANRVHGRLHHQHEAGRMVDDIAEEVQARLGATELRALHEHHALGRIVRGKTIHDLAQVGRARGTPSPRLGGQVGQKPMLVGPLRDGERRFGRRALAPDGIDPGGDVIHRAAPGAECPQDRRGARA